MPRVNLIPNYTYIFFSSCKQLLTNKTKTFAEFILNNINIFRELLSNNTFSEFMSNNRPFRLTKIIAPSVFLQVFWVCVRFEKLKNGHGQDICKDTIP